MSERESWMPSDHAIREACASASWGERGKVMELIRSAVSGREAELEERHAREIKAARAALASVLSWCPECRGTGVPRQGSREYGRPVCGYCDTERAALAALDAEPKPCDVPGCQKQADCRTNTDTGYRHTCLDHIP